MTGRLTVKNGKYYVVISYNDGNTNKQKWVATGLDEKNNKREATEAMREIIAKFDTQAKYGITTSVIKSKKDSPLFGDYLKNWLEAAKPNLQLTTFGSYQRYINNIAPYFNDRKITLNRLTHADIRDYYAFLMRDKGKSIHNCLHRHTIMRRALEIAYRTDMIQINPMDKVERPKVPKYNAKFYDLKQLKRLFGCIEGDRFELLYKMTAFYGLRRSEICGLKWNAINFEDNLIHISHAVVQTTIDGKLMRVSKDIMKNKSSKRTMPLIPEIKNMLLNEKRNQERNLSRYGKQYFLNDSEYIFVDDLGKLVSPGTISAHFQMILARNGLPKIRFHELRHSCASLLIACGIGMKEVQEWLGHSAMSTTADIYSHLNFSSKVGVASTLTNVLGGKPIDIKEVDNDLVSKSLGALFHPSEHSIVENESVYGAEYNMEDADFSLVEGNDDFGEDEADDETYESMDVDDFEPAIEYHENNAEDTPHIKPLAKENENVSKTSNSDNNSAGACEFVSEKDTVNEFRRMKEDMARLGFNNINEYLDYLDFIEMRRSRKQEMEM